MQPKTKAPAGKEWRPSNVGKSRVDPRKYGAQCATCPFAKDQGPSQPVWGEGPANPIGVLVGEGPGRDEAEKGKPFVGATGQALDVELFHASLDRTKLLVVNATCCQPKQPKKETEMRQAVLCCRATLLHQLRKIDPNTPVLALGKWAYFALTLKDKGVMKARGFIRWAFQIPTVETERTQATIKQAKELVKFMSRPSGPLAKLFTKSTRGSLPPSSKG